MITGIVKSEKSSPYSVEVFWTIGKLDKKLKENCILHSVPFHHAGQIWQLALSACDHTLEGSLIYFSILRKTVSKDEHVGFPVVCWNMGILDSDGRSHYGCSDFERLGIVFQEKIVANFSGPEFTHLCLQKDLYMPDDKITIDLRLILHSCDALIKDKGDPTPMLEQSNSIKAIFSNFVVVNVKDQTFYADEFILDGISKDIKLKIIDRIGGRMTVLDLPDCDKDAFEWFLSFKHSRETKGLTDDIAREVYDIAYKFRVPKLKSECVQRFLRNLDVSSVCGFLEMAERYHDQALKEECSEFFLENAREILNTSEWLEFMAKRTKLANELIISNLDSIGGGSE